MENFEEMFPRYYLVWYIKKHYSQKILYRCKPVNLLKQDAELVFWGGVFLCRWSKTHLPVKYLTMMNLVTYQSNVLSSTVIYYHSVIYCHTVKCLSLLFFIVCLRIRKFRRNVSYYIYLFIKMT